MNRRQFRTRAGLVAVAATIGGCSSSTPTYVEPDAVVIWSTDDQPAELPADSPARADPQISIGELRNATVLADDGDRVIVVGDRVEVQPFRAAYLLDGDGRMLLLLGALDSTFDAYSGVPGSRLGAGVDPSATSARVFSSTGVRSVPTYRDPVTGATIAIVAARDGETLYGIHAIDGAGRVTDVVGMPPAS